MVTNFGTKFSRATMTTIVAECSWYFLLFIITSPFPSYHLFHNFEGCCIWSIYTLFAFFLLQIIQPLFEFVFQVLCSSLLSNKADIYPNLHFPSRSLHCAWCMSISMILESLLHLLLLIADAPCQGLHWCCKLLPAITAISLCAKLSVLHTLRPMSIRRWCKP
jgi:hypothetical protein